MGPKRGRARMVGRGREGRGATGRGTPIEDVGDQGVASQTQQGVDRGVTSRGSSTRQGAGRGNPTPVVPEAHSGASGRETTPEVPVIPSQFAREVAAAMLEMERTRHEEICIQREATSARFREGMKEFRKMNPPSFDGLGDPVVAGHWLSQIRKIFDTVRITEDDMKVSFASYQLIGEANEWWESIKEAKGVDRDLVNTEAKKCKRFENGLNPSFRLYVISQRIRNFSDLLNCARRVEPKREQRKEFKDSWEPRQMSVGTSSTNSGEVSARRDREITHRDQLGSRRLGHQFQLHHQIRVTQAGSQRVRLFIIGAISQVTFARSAHREYVTIVASKVTFLQIVHKGRILTVELGQCNSRVQDILLIISKGTNNRGTNHISRVSQSLLSEDLEWREGMLLLHPSSFQDREGDMCRVRECREGFMQLLMQQQFHLRLSLL
ncbi:hypothetical protein Acr_27g0000420 [Actinidia rufa]|uniref:Retrotransposon gag domain-containing protein n=1 Tax=Actinidia rufa TaxID=165716 RepID=A0A7J0H5C5_9ERIC|nr:hypothetical protein Acr_27g0000420 [Actinidia rufa]